MTEVELPGKDSTEKVDTSKLNGEMKTSTEKPTTSHSDWELIQSRENQLLSQMFSHIKSLMEKSTKLMNTKPKDPSKHQEKEVEIQTERGPNFKWDMKKRLKIVKEAMENGVNNVCFKYDLNSGVVKYWKYLFKKFGKDSLSDSGRANAKKANRPFRDVEEDLYDWYQEQTSMNKFITKKMLLDQGAAIAHDHKNPDFKNTPSWLGSFLKFYKIDLAITKLQNKEKEDQSRQSCFLNHLLNFRALNIVDFEVWLELFYYTFYFDNDGEFYPELTDMEDPPQEPRQKRRVTVFMCTSYTGEFFKPTFIFQYQGAPKLMQKRKDTFSDMCHIRWNNTGQMTKQLLQEWFAETLQPQAERKTLLICMNMMPYWQGKHKEQLPPAFHLWMVKRSLRRIFLPSELIKHTLLKNVLEKYRVSVEGNTVIINFEEVLIRSVMKSLDEITPETMKESFDKCGFKTEDNTKKDWVKSCLPKKHDLLKMAADWEKRETIITQVHKTGAKAPREDPMSCHTDPEYTQAAGTQYPGGPSSQALTDQNPTFAANKRKITKEVLELVQRLGLADACNLFGVTLERPMKGKPLPGGIGEGVGVGVAAKMVGSMGGLNEMSMASMNKRVSEAGESEFESYTQGMLGKRGEMDSSVQGGVGGGDDDEFGGMPAGMGVEDDRLTGMMEGSGVI